MDDIIYKYFDLSDNQKEKIHLMLDVYQFWNEKVNLISRKDIECFYERHVLHSLSISKVFSFHSDSKILDLGSGGGFPGIPLAIFFPDVQFVLLDSIYKKTKTVQSIIHELGLSNVSVLNERVETLRDSFDFVVCRAVANLTQLDHWTQDLISSEHNHSFKNGLICLKGGDLTEETSAFINRLTIYDIQDFFAEDFFVQKKILHLT